jgi:hypothetical protein
MAAGASRRLPDHDDAAIDLAIEGFPTARLKATLRSLLQADTWPDTSADLAEHAENLDEAVGRIVDARKDGTAHRLGPFADRLVRGARANGHDLPEGQAVSALTAIVRWGVTGQIDDPALGETLDDVAADFAEGLSGAIDVETLKAGLRLVMAATSDGITEALAGLSPDRLGAIRSSLTPGVAREIVAADLHWFIGTISDSTTDPGARLLQVVEEARPEYLAAAVQAALPMADLTKAFGFHDAQNERERHRVAAELAPACLLFAQMLGRAVIPGTPALATLAQLFNRPDRAQHYRMADAQTQGH